ncbi:uncharacterized protein LOC135223206 [Macrobrachium nipponense]|uniref:uncharacterized protein LOC135223206 n=1 Tax=Macrobrachium nipponense TaxID=159736 RepID=UPI0030C84A51
MKVLVIATVCVAVAFCQTRIPAKPSVRNVNADVLRDFPGACFASTACKVFKVGESWPLTPFCGRSTCVQEGEKLIEKIEDCGLRPKESPGCKVVNEADLQKAYPDCCPVFECQEGATLQYPTEAEIAAAIAAQPAPSNATEASTA